MVCYMLVNVKAHAPRDLRDESQELLLFAHSKSINPWI